MIAGKSAIAAGATMLTVGAMGGIGINAATKNGQSETLAQRPIVETDIQTIHRTIHIKPKGAATHSGSSGVSHVTAASGGGVAYAASSPREVSASDVGERQGMAPTVSTHSSGGYGEDRGAEDSHDNEHHDDGAESEGSDD